MLLAENSSCASGFACRLLSHAYAYAASDVVCKRHLCNCAILRSHGGYTAKAAHQIFHASTLKLTSLSSPALRQSREFLSRQRTPSSGSLGVAHASRQSPGTAPKVKEWYQEKDHAEQERKYIASWGVEMSPKACEVMQENLKTIRSNDTLFTRVVVSIMFLTIWVYTIIVL